MLLDEKAAAERLGVTVRFLQSRRAKRIPPNFVRVGRLVRYDMDDIREFLRAGRVECNAQSFESGASEAER